MLLNLCGAGGDASFAPQAYLVFRPEPKFGTETRSWRPKWPIIGHYFCTTRNMHNIWKTGPDS